MNKQEIKKPRGVRYTPPRLRPHSGRGRHIGCGGYGRWQAQIAVGNRVFYLGSYADERSAAQAYDYAVFYLRAYRKAEEYNDPTFAVFLQKASPPGPGWTFLRESDLAYVKHAKAAFARIPPEPLGDAECGYCGRTDCSTPLEHRLRLIKNALDQREKS